MRRRSCSGEGSGRLLAGGGVAIVGSRDADASAEAFARRLAIGLAAGSAPVVSGGDRGVDSWAMGAALSAGGLVVGVLPEGVERRLRDPENRAGVAGGRATLISPYRPDASFSAGAAMARDKLIYALADVAVVVSSANGSGGTWTGAVEALKAGWVPVLVRTGEGVPDGKSRARASRRPSAPDGRPVRRDRPWTRSSPSPERRTSRLPRVRHPSSNRPCSTTERRD